MRRHERHGENVTSNRPPTLAPDMTAVLELLPDAVVCIDNDGVITGAWGACMQVFGNTPAELVGMNGYARLHPDDVAYAAGALFEALGRDDAHVPVCLRVSTSDGRWVVVEAASGVGSLFGSEALLMSLRPLTYRDHMDDRRSELQQRCLSIASELAAAHAHQLEAALVCAVASIGEFMNTTAVRFCAPGTAAVSVGDDVHWPRESDLGVSGFADHGRVGDHSVYEVEVPANGPARWWLAWDEQDPGRAGWDGAHLEHLRLVGAIAASASARRSLEVDLVRRSRLDPLTGLVNSHTLEASLQDMLDVGAVTVLFCDLDDFKPVNDRFGHAFGDSVLAVAAERLGGTLRASDLLGRVGGDEFVAACPSMTSADAVAAVQRLEDSLVLPIVFNGQEVTIGVSVGAATGEKGSTAATLIAAADNIMYSIKEFRRNPAPDWL